MFRIYPQASCQDLKSRDKSIRITYLEERGSINQGSPKNIFKKQLKISAGFRNDVNYFH